MAEENIDMHDPVVGFTPNTGPSTEGGGFLLPSLPSPSPSTASSISYLRNLPEPRKTPLKHGSKPETALITYLDEGLLNVSRKYAKKFTEGGYTDVKSIVKDLEKLVDLLWISASPTLQVPYLLQIANSFNDYLHAFPLSLKATITFLDLLDRFFYFLITGEAPSPELAPSLAYVSRKKLTTTEKVRLKSIIERTRLHLVKIAEGGPNVSDVDPPTESVPDIGERPTTPTTEAGETSVVDEDDEYLDDEEEEELEMMIARVYERSLVEVGEQLRNTA